MNEYKYVLTRKYPFVKKRPLTQLERITRTALQVETLFIAVIPILIIIKLLYMFDSIKQKIMRRI